MGTLLGKKPFIRFSLLTSSHFLPKTFLFSKASILFELKPVSGFFLQIRTVHKYKIYRNGNNYFLQIRIVRSEPLCPDFCQGTLQSLNLRFWGKIEQNWCLRRIKDGESSLMRTDSHSDFVSNYLNPSLGQISALKLYWWSGIWEKIQIYPRST